jgi:hypothetical protein
MPLVNFICHHPLFKHVCSNCRREFLACSICHPEVSLCDLCKPFRLVTPSHFEQFKRVVVNESKRHVKAQDHLSKVIKNIRDQRGMHVTRAGVRYTAESWERRKEFSRQYYKLHAEENRKKKREKYHINLEESRARVRLKYQQNLRDMDKVYLWRNKNREILNQKSRDRYAQNSENILFRKKKRRSDPLVREHDNHMQKLRRLRNVN